MVDPGAAGTLGGMLRSLGVVTTEPDPELPAVTKGTVVVKAPPEYLEKVAEVFKEEVTDRGAAPGPVVTPEPFPEEPGGVTAAAPGPADPVTQDPDVGMPTIITGAGGNLEGTAAEILKSVAAAKKGGRSK